MNRAKKTFKPTDLGPTCLVICPNSVVDNWARELETVCISTCRKFLLHDLTKLCLLPSVDKIFQWGYFEVSSIIIMTTVGFYSVSDSETFQVGVLRSDKNLTHILSRFKVGAYDIRESIWRPRRSSELTS